MSFCSRRHKDKTIPLAPCQAFSFDSDSSNLSSSACMKTIHLNDTKPKCEELSSHKPQSDLVLLDIYSGCGGMSTGLCLGAKLSGLDLVTKWALDINKFACESLKLNHPETQIRNESAEDFLDLLKEWDKLCKRYAVKDVEGATKSNIKLLRASQNNLYSKTDEKIPSGEYEVASLIDICYGDPSDTGKRGLKFQVRWVGYGPSEDTWEPIEGLSKCEDRIQDFVLKGFKAKILPWPGANFRDLSGVVVGADNVARRDPTAEPILLPSGRPLLILATIPDEKHGKSPSIVTEDNIKLIFEIQKRVDGLRANYSGSMVSLTDICMKPLGQDCATQSVLQYFKMDPKNYDDYGGVEHTEYCFQILSNRKCGGYSSCTSIRICIGDGSTEAEQR